MRTWEDEYLRDERDSADAHFVLDGIGVVKLHDCPSCRALPCVCDEEEAPARWRRYRSAQRNVEEL